MWEVVVRRSFPRRRIGRARHVGEDRQRPRISPILGWPSSFSLRPSRWRLIAFARRRKTDAEELERGPMASQPKPLGIAPWEDITSGPNGTVMEMVGEKVDSASSTGIPGDTPPLVPRRRRLFRSRPRYQYRFPRPPHPLFTFQNRPHSLIDTARRLSKPLLAGCPMRGLRGINFMSSVHKGGIADGAPRMF